MCPQSATVSGSCKRMLAFAMPSSLTREQVTAVAALANLDLDPAEIDLFARQLGAILEYAEQVQQVDTSGVAPTTGGGEGRTAGPPGDARARRGHRRRGGHA